MVNRNSFLEENDFNYSLTHWKRVIVVTLSEHICIHDALDNIQYFFRIFRITRTF